MPARLKIGKKTLFNLLGPHTNPCGAKRQILGVYQKDLVRTFASVARNLSMDHALIVHGFDGLDEITITDSTYVAELKDNTISEYEISPKDFGLSLSTLSEITAISPDARLQLIRDAFSGDKSAVQDMIALNAGAALYLAKKVDSIADGIELSFELMNNGMAADKLASYVRVSNS